MELCIHPTLCLCGKHVDHLPFMVLWLIATCKCMVSWNSKYRICPRMSSKTELFFVFEIKQWMKSSLVTCCTVSVFECLFFSILSACHCIPLLRRRVAFCVQKRARSCGFVFIMTQHWHTVCQVGLYNCLVE